MNPARGEVKGCSQVHTDRNSEILEMVDSHRSPCGSGRQDQKVRLGRLD